VTNAGGKWEAKEIYRLRGNKPVANHWSTPVLFGGNLYGMFSFKAYASGPVKCVEIATGNVKWEQPGFGAGQAILAGDRVMALSDAGEIVIIDPKPDAYKEVARAKLVEGKCWSTPVFSNGRLYVRSTKEAACFDLGAGTAAR
jgi:outer membrane protein assembly factor BamB